MNTKTKPTILIDSSLTGGRGPAKKTYEFIQRCKELNVQYQLISNTAFKFKLDDLGILPDYLVDVCLTDNPKTTIKQYRKVISQINYDCLVRFGARVPGPTQARLNNKPYIIVDGGLPDKLELSPSLYDQQTFIQAQKYYITTQFPWKYPVIPEMNNIQVAYYPISNKTIKFIEQLRKQSKRKTINEIIRTESQFKILRQSPQLFINLIFTGDFLTNPKDRLTYGAWLTTRQYDACIGFVRRLITDLGVQKPSPTTIFLDKEIKSITQDLLVNFPQLTCLTYQNKWNYQTEIRIQKVADINISRATNYQPYIALLGNGGSITSPVPADGYMDEDTAAYQYLALGMTEVISYDDEYYVQKLLKFSQDQNKQKQISQQQIKIATQFLKTSNSADLILQTLNLIKK